MSEMTAADIALLDGNNNNMWNNPFVYLVWLSVFRGFGNGWGGSDAATQGALTRADLTEGLNFQTMGNDIRALGSDLNGIQSQMCNGFASVNSAIAQSDFNAQQCCCSINRNIDQSRYEMAQNVGLITSTIHAEAEATRQALIDQQIQDLRDSREATQRELQSAQLTLANAAQTQNILGSIGRYVPYAGCGAGCGCTSW